MVLETTSPDERHHSLQDGAQHWMKIVGPSGHTTMTWTYDPDVAIEDQEEANLARLRFKEELAKKKAAFPVNHQGEGVGGQIRVFDPKAEGIMMVAALQGG